MPTTGRRFRFRASSVSFRGCSVAEECHAGWWSRVSVVEGVEVEGVVEGSSGLAAYGSSERTAMLASSLLLLSSTLSAAGASPTMRWKHLRTWTFPGAPCYPQRCAVSSACAEATDGPPLARTGRGWWASRWTVAWSPVLKREKLVTMSERWAAGVGMRRKRARRHRPRR